jgi:hypothetical protein
MQFGTYISTKYDQYESRLCDFCHKLHPVPMMIYPPQSPDGTLFFDVKWLERKAPATKYAMCTTNPPSLTFYVHRLIKYDCNKWRWLD